MSELPQIDMLPVPATYLDPATVWRVYGRTIDKATFRQQDCSLQDIPHLNASGNVKECRVCHLVLDPINQQTHCTSAQPSGHLVLKNTACKHAFHAACLDHLLEFNANICPFCNSHWYDSESELANAQDTAEFIAYMEILELERPEIDSAKPVPVASGEMQYSILLAAHHHLRQAHRVLTQHPTTQGLVATSADGPLLVGNILKAITKLDGKSRNLESLAESLVDDCFWKTAEDNVEKDMTWEMQEFAKKVVGAGLTFYVSVHQI